MRRFNSFITLAGLALIASSLTALTQTAFAQVYPFKPIRLIVPFAPGGPSDQAARTIGQALSKSLGQPFVIENRPGADGAIAAQTLRNASPDGYSLLFSGAPMIPLALLKNPPPFDVQADFAPVARVTRLVWGMFVSPHVPAASLTELIAHARASPTRLSYASSNLIEFLAASQFMKGTGTNMLRVPYKGAGQAMPDLLAGRVHVMFAPLSAGLAYLPTGQLRLLAMLTPERSQFAPDVPTLTEAGILEISIPGWQGILAPAKTPKNVIATLHTAIERALQDPEVRTQLERQAVLVDMSTADQLSATIAADMRTWAEFLRENPLTNE